MSGSSCLRLLSCSLVAAVFVAGCSGEAPSAETSGSLALSLVLASGSVVDEVPWTISGGDMDPMSGTIDTSAPGATASVEVYGLPPGEGYLVELEAMTDDGETTCRGDAEFDVRAGVATEVMVMLNCKPPLRLGGVRVNGKLNICAQLDKAVASPLETSIGSQIDLFARASDEEGDAVRYLWTATDGSIANPTARSTTYTCNQLGQHFIQISVSDDDFGSCEDSWTVPVTCVEGDPAPMCVPAARNCFDSSIDEVSPCCALTAPAQQSACTGNESLENPTSCTATGNTITHKLTVLEVAPSCNDGFDLDGCDGNSCALGGLAPSEGINGVDNALTALAPLLVNVGANLGGVNQAFSDALCGLTSFVSECTVPISPLEIWFVVDANPDENCANVRVQSGASGNDIILNLGEPTAGGTVCASGTIGTLPLSLVGFAGALENAVIRMTVSEAGFSDGLLGATIDKATAIAIAELLLEGAGAVIAQVLDIGRDLTQDTSVACDALSSTFAVGGVAEASPEP